MVQQNPPAMQETQKIWVLSLSQEESLEKGMATHTTIFAGKSHGQRSLVDYTVHCVTKSQTCLSGGANTHALWSV